MSVFDGTQPTFTQVPPSVPPSTRATRASRSAALMAAANPAEPPPTIRRSNSPPVFLISVGTPDPETVVQRHAGAVYALQSLQGEPRGRGTAPARHLRDVQPNRGRIPSLGSDAQILQAGSKDSSAA